ncbi:shikimate dehydrogenase [Salipiger aestuarii]|uniref:shikimate dehydrogenase n=1 Tax=Salipiger aestuarii TaxID=568098 RepID=UPI00025B6F92|nr:shikimate dehydrogenase [Salipiger aestuarii]EIE50061.1 shikimate 5-dehydrogenase [Citreicella sp. 357]KAA8609853.1 shikimate dehydrogenase [Salipiger aestuarii]KAA8616165.1 shikimate dehydrogenase [Salipiger aestuarii]
MTVPSIPLAGVIGAPVGHSRSPRLHGHWLKTHDLPGHYVPLEIAADVFEDALRMLPKLGFVGVNITIPYKERVIEIADLVSDRATLIGAANTIIFRADGRIHADNTDGYGFIENLRQGAPGWDAKAGPAVVLGAGGAARAVVASLLELGAPEIRLTNRTRLRADALRAEFGNRITVVEWVQAGNVLDDAALVVNSTSLGMVGKPELRVPLDGLRKGTVVTDLVYTPLQTRLLKVAAEHGCTCVDGLGMLIHQAVPGFERWFGQRPDINEATRGAIL